MISKGRKVYEYDGKGRYRYFPFLHGRTIIPKHVLDIESGLLNLHDCNDLPFGVELSIKVQVTDPQKVAASLTQLDHSTLSKVVEDIVMTTARSIAMERTILDIMKNREEIEKSVYEIVVDALNKLGISVIIFDIKNIRDVEGRDVIGSLEREEQARLEQERQARLEQERQARLEQERQARLEQERQARLEQERQARLEQERQARLEQERQARLEQERQARLEQERQARLEQERQARLEQEQQTRLEPEQEQKLIAEIEQKKARIIADADREKELIETQAEVGYKTLTYKICVFGNSRVGKTTLIDRYLTNTFHNDLKSTLGATIHVKKYDLENGKITLQVWDFGGEEKFRFLIKPYFQGSAGGVFAFDLTNYESLINMVEWVPEFKKICRDAPIIMAGCKLDLEKERICQKEEALDLLNAYNLNNYIECSSKTGENSEAVFRDLLMEILKNAGHTHLNLN